MGKDEWWVLFQAHETFFLLYFCFFFICALFLIHAKKHFVLLPLSPWERGPGGEGLGAGGSGPAGIRESISPGRMANRF